MSWSIRTRLTLWYLAIVVAVLASGALAASLVLRQRGVERLDEDLDRTMATLLGVMRTEFNEGLDLDASAAEASVEVVAPGRALSIARPDGRLLIGWGLPVQVSLPPATANGTTIETPSGAFRVARRVVDDGPGRNYIAVVAAPMRDLEAPQAELVRAMWAGIALALCVAGLGGWIIGRQALSPLATMAQQARFIDAQRPRERLTVSRPDDEIGQVAVAFNDVLDRLATALEQQRQFMADASHELRTPVSVVRTTAQVTLKHPTRTLSEYRESLTIVSEQSHRLARIVDAMFLLSRAEADGVPLQAEYVNLDDIVAESVRAIRVLAEQRGVSVAQRGDEEVGLTGDDGLLRRMVGNLLDNAIRHAHEGSQVVAEVKIRGDHAVFRVTNDGPAITAADTDRIFERFVRVGPSNGAGLGLPIARWIAQAHGGSLLLEETGPMGTTFAAAIPITTDRP